MFRVCTIHIFLLSYLEFMQKTLYMIWWWWCQYILSICTIVRVAFRVWLEKTYEYLPIFLLFQPSSVHIWYVPKTLKMKKFLPLRRNRHQHIWDLFYALALCNCYFLQIMMRFLFTQKKYFPFWCLL